VNESDFSSQIEDALELYGWKWVHFRPARVRRNGKDTYETPYTGHRGALDYYAVRGSRIIFFELKGDGGKLRPEQKEWIEALKETCAEVYVWWPKDSDEAMEVLR